MDDGQTPDRPAHRAKTLPSILSVMLVPTSRWMNFHCMSMTSFGQLHRRSLHTANRHQVWCTRCCHSRYSRSYLCFGTILTNTVPSMPSLALGRTPLIRSLQRPKWWHLHFGPLIVQSFGYDSFKTILFNIPFGAVQLVATLGGAFLATHWKRKGPVLALLCIPPIIDCVILIAVEHTAKNRRVLLFGYYIISFYPGISFSAFSRAIA